MPPVFAEPNSSRLQRHLRWRPSDLLAIGGLLVTGVLLGLTWAISTPIVDEITGIERLRLPRLELIQTARSADMEASLALRNVLLIRNDRLNEIELRRYAQANQVAESAWNSFGATFKRPQENKLLQATIRARRALHGARADAIEADQRGGLADADALTVRLQGVLDTYLAASSQLQNDLGAQVASLVDAVAARADHVRLLLVAAGIASAITMLLLAASMRSELRRQVSERDRRIASLQEQRDALVREVHHRIKNHLQGLLGLFETRQLLNRSPQPADGIATLHGHVLALVGVHGLQAREATESIALEDLVRQQVDLVRVAFPAAQLAVTEGEDLEETRLPADLAVPVALIVTELIVNAIKHGATAPIRISIGMAQQRPYVAVVNRLAAPTHLDWHRERGLGTGLSLVSTLLQGIAELVQSGSSQEFIMTLSLHAVTQTGSP
jgi:two-component sensor histidine kinase